MTHYYLAPYRGSGSQGDPFEPDHEGQDGWAAIDLRPDARRADGVALLAVPSALRVRPNRLHLGDSLDEDSPALQRGVASLLAVNLQDRRLRRIARSLLVEHADTVRRDRWNPLAPGHDGWFRIHLGEQIDAFPRPSGGATISDDFNSGTITALADAQNTHVVSSGVLRIVSAGLTGFTRTTSDLAGSDMYSQIVAVESGSDARAAGATARMSASALTYYLFFINNAGGGAGFFAWLYKSIAGSFTQLGSSVASSLATGDTVTCESNGSSIAGYLSGASVIAATDTAIVGNRRAGTMLSQANGTTNIGADSFVAADLTANVARSVGGGAMGLSIPISGPVAYGGEA